MYATLSQIRTSSKVDHGLSLGDRFRME
ncbi:protein of unknown function [Micropruina glycogenica]|uniref:Uncharacterized protein n=1 Tax=Micropruina glycogenica TaxID=75385 RepID=A0A2N9JH01_9ACTN|nr:protein of unknown function [Micropruina glycogenica]